MSESKLGLVVVWSCASANFTLATKMGSERALPPPPPPPMDISGSAHEVSVRWKKYIRSFQYYATGKDITDAKRLESLLLHFAGPEVQDIFETLPDLPAVPHGGAARSEFETAKGKLDNYFAHEPNTAFERHLLRRMTQLEGETVAQFCQRLHQQAEFCSFPDKEDALKGQLVEGVRDAGLRKKLLDKTGLILTEASTIARQHETTEASVKGMKAASSANAGEIRQVLPRVAKPTPTPRRPECANCGEGEHLAVDLLGPLPTGEHLMVLVDYYSRFYEVDVLRSTTSEVVRERLAAHLHVMACQTAFGPTMAHSLCQLHLWHFWRNMGYSTEDQHPIGHGPMEKSSGKTVLF